MKFWSQQAPACVPWPSVQPALEQPSNRAGGSEDGDERARRDVPAAWKLSRPPCRSLYYLPALRGRSVHQRHPTVVSLAFGQRLIETTLVYLVHALKIRWLAVA